MAIPWMPLPYGVRLLGYCERLPRSEDDPDMIEGESGPSHRRALRF